MILKLTGAFVTIAVCILLAVHIDSVNQRRENCRGFQESRLLDALSWNAARDRAIVALKGSNDENAAQNTAVQVQAINTYGRNILAKKELLEEEQREELDAASPFAARHPMPLYSCDDANPMVPLLS